MPLRHAKACATTAEQDILIAGILLLQPRLPVENDGKRRQHIGALDCGVEKPLAVGGDVRCAENWGDPEQSTWRPCLERLVRVHLHSHLRRTAQIEVEKFLA